MRHVISLSHPHGLREISLPKPLSAILLILISASLITRWYLPAIGPVVMDEFVDTQLACQMAKGVDLYYDGSAFPRMPFLEHLLSWFCDGTQDGFTTVVTARRVMVGGSMVIMLFTYLTARRVFGPAVGLLALFMLCTYTTFLDRSFHVRADLITTMFATGALFLMTLSSSFATIIAGAFLGLAIMTTQKAIYFVIAFVAAVIFGSLTCEQNLKNASRVVVKETFLSMLGMSVCLAVYFVYIYLRWDFDAFSKRVFVDAFEAGVKSDLYKETWIYLHLTIIRNPVFWVLGVSSVIFAIIISVVAMFRHDENRHQYKLLAMVGGWGAVQLFFTAYHTVKFPYFFLNISPILAIASSLALAFILSFIFTGNFLKNWQKTLFATVLILAIAYLPAKRHFSHFENTKITEIQKAIINEVESITSIDDAVLDGVGMVVSRKKATPYSMTHRWHVRRQTGQYSDVLDWIGRTQPKVFIHNYRYDRFNLVERNYIQDNFIHYWSNIWVAGKKIEFRPGVTEIPIEVISSTEYAIICDDISKVFVDGKSVKLSIYLESGHHMIKVEEPVQKITLLLASAYTQRKPDFPDKLYTLFPSYDE